MKKVKITVMKRAVHQDLIDLYENPISNPCDMQIGAEFFSDGYEKPVGLCESAWENLSKYVFALSSGGQDFFDGWMKEPKSAMISCNDGFRPVSFLLEIMNGDLY